jgi:hypothetical protein
MDVGDGGYARRRNTWRVKSSSVGCMGWPNDGEEKPISAATAADNLVKPCSFLGNLPNQMNNLPSSE